MERKIGEKFECGGKTYRVVANDSCAGCASRGSSEDCTLMVSCGGVCSCVHRTDGKQVIFQNVEDVEAVNVDDSYKELVNQYNEAKKAMETAMQEYHHKLAHIMTELAYMSSDIEHGIVECNDDKLKKKIYQLETKISIADFQEGNVMRHLIDM